MDNPTVERAERLIELAEDFRNYVADDATNLAAPDYRYLAIALAAVTDALAAANRDLFRLLADLYDARNRDYNSLQSTLYSSGRRRPW
jgi:hypothetical protein